MTSATERKSYYDLSVNIEQENSWAYELRDKIKRRIELKQSIDLAEVERKALDKEIKAFMEDWDVEGIVLGLGSEEIVDLASGGGGFRADKATAERILTPDQVNQIFKKSGKYTYVKVSRSTKRVAQALQE